jgi:hypothetical protein
MRISDFDFHLSKESRALLKLLIKLNEDSQIQSGVNLSKEIVPLSKEESRRLIVLLDDLLVDKDFAEGVHFAEELTAIDTKKLSTLKNIFLAARKRRGKSGLNSAYLWFQVLSRYGLKEFGTSRNTERLDFERFLQMEEFLFLKVGLSEGSAENLLKKIKRKKISIEAARKNKKRVPAGATKRIVKSARKQASGSKNKESFISKVNLDALTITLANLGAFATTRDWNVVSGVSMVAGSLVAIKK